MPTLTAWCYQTPLGARRGEARLHRLEDAEALQVHCAIVVTWAPGAHRPRAAHVRHRGGDDLDDASMLSVVARTVLAVATAPSPSSAADTALGHLPETGIDSSFLTSAARRFAPGSSVLLVLSGRADLDVVRSMVQQGVAAGEVELVRTEVPPDAVRRIATLLDRPDG